MKFQSEWPQRRFPSVPRGLLLASVQLSILLLIGFSLWIDRVTRPRAWVATEPFDPNLPIRGRYLSLRLVVPVEAGGRKSIAPLEPGSKSSSTVQLKVLGNRLVAFEGDGGARHAGSRRSRGGAEVVVLQEPLAFFIPADVRDPSRRAADDPLWVEVTLPHSGSPRPVRLGEERQGRIVPLDLRSTESGQ